MSWDEPYGELRESTVRVASWNVWGRFGPWQERESVILDELRRVDADIVCLQEAWVYDGKQQAERFGEALGLYAVHHGEHEYEGVVSGQAILSRWPIEHHEARKLEGFHGGTGGGATYARIAGPREPIDVISLILDWRLDLGHVRAAQLTEVLQWASDLGDLFHPLFMCGDFNAPPDSDELRAVVGLSPVHVPRMVFYDAIGMCAEGDTSTFTMRNPYSAVGLYPERRLDHIFSHWPKAHGVGHPVAAGLLGTEPQGEIWASDHFGVYADLRY